MQSRLQSLLEAFINVAIGYGVALGAQLLVFPLFGIHIPLAQNLAIGAIFTIVSIGRSYAVRRLFNYFHKASNEIHPSISNPNRTRSPAEDI